MPTYNKERKAKTNFDKISISLASPEEIKERSSGATAASSATVAVWK